MSMVKQIAGIFMFMAGLAFSQTSFNPETVTVRPDMVYGRKFGMALTLDMYQPAQPNGAAVIFINSGGYVSGKLRQFETLNDGTHRFVMPENLMLFPENFHYEPLEQFSFVDLLSRGFTVIDLLHGSSPRFTLDEIADDVQKGVAFVAEHAVRWNIDSKRLGICGASAGGHLAILYGLTADTSHRMCSMAAYYPAGYDYVDVAQRFPQVVKEIPALQIEEALLDTLSLKHHITPDDPPLFMIYGADDFPFITETCDSLEARFHQINRPCKKITLPKTGHEFRGEAGYHSQHGLFAREEIVKWFEKTL